MLTPAMRLAWIAAPALAAAVTVAQAQVTPDGTLGTTVNLSGTDFQVNGGTQLGGNLFHSFGSFSLDGQSATFSGPADVGNVISRVTGGAPSSINGTVNSTIAGANFYFVNPAGVMFGANARINVGGSFVATTAQQLLLGGGGRFAAVTDPAASTLTSAPPEAFGFLGGQGAIGVASGAILRTPRDATISLVGGALDVAGTITAESGRIDLIATSGAGEARLNATGADVTTGAGNIALEAARLGTTGLAAGVSGGLIYLRGGDIVCRNCVASSGNAIATDAFVEGASGAIRIEASGELALLGTNAVIRADNESADAGGSIHIDAASVRLLDGASITALARGAGNGGLIDIDATGAVVIDGRSPDSTLVPDDGTGIFARALGTGAGGTIDITAQSLQLLDRGRLGASATPSPPDLANAGASGAINVTVVDLLMDHGGRIASAPNGTASGGVVTINASNAITLTGADAAFEPTAINIINQGSGAGGNLVINAGQLSIDGNAQLLGEASGSGAGGSIQVTAGDVSLTRGGRISVSGSATGAAGQITLDLSGRLSIDGLFADLQTGQGVNPRSGLYLQTAGGAAGGLLDVASREILISNGGRIEATNSGTQVGSSIALAATELIRISERSEIGADTTGSGDGGTIAIDTATLEVIDGALITAETSGIGPAAGAGGSIDVRASREVLIDGRVNNPANNATTGLVARTTGDGRGGGITVQAPLLNMFELGRLGASAVPNRAAGASGGPGGGITVLADEVLMGQGASIAAATNGDGDDDLGGFVHITATRSIRLFADGTATTGINVGSIVTPGGPFAGTGGAGAGGNLTLSAPLIVLDGDSRVLAEAQGAGAGGNILVGADRLLLADGAQIAARASGSGVAGTVTLAIGDTLSLTGGSVISTATTGSDGGNIFVDVGRLLYLRDSAITTSAGGGAGNGGNITLNLPDGVGVLQRSRIIANAFGGNGGNIFITAAGFIASPDSVIDASSTLGINGDVRIVAPATDFGASLAPLATGFLDASSLLRAGCAADARAQNSLIVAGNGGLPPGARDPLYSSLGELLQTPGVAARAPPAGLFVAAQCGPGSLAW